MRVLFRFIAIVYCFFQAQSTYAGDGSQVELAIDPQQVINSNVSPNTFGFAVDWYQFQLGYYREGKVRPEVIQWLKPFKGAVYRYSGGNTFEWRKAVGPLNERKKMAVNFEGAKLPEFGPNEFLRFINQVDGNAVVLLNVKGNSPADIMADDNLDYLNWFSQNGAKCVSGQNCPIKYFELGNEVDTEKGIKWGANYYAKRITPFIVKAKRKYPDIKFAVVGKTIPWDSIYDVDGKDFDEVVAKEVGGLVDAVTFHPYYDGRSVMDMNAHIDKMLSKYKKVNPNINALITEHGRWPTIPHFGRWEDNWYQASGSWGGLSAADFIVQNLDKSDIAGMMWHMIATKGPWQLIHLNKSNDTVYPSATYWFLRTIREGFYESIVQVNPKFDVGLKKYGGKYDQRFIAMKGRNGDLSLIGINRSNSTKELCISIKGNNYNKVFKYNYVSATEDGLDNNDRETELIKMTSTSIQAADVSCYGVNVPARSAFSIIFSKQVE